MPATPPFPPAPACLQLVFYGSYHANPINQLIHFIFVPALWWTAAGGPKRGGGAGGGRVHTREPATSTPLRFYTLKGSGRASPSAPAFTLLLHPSPASPAACPDCPDPHPSPDPSLCAVWLCYTPQAFSLDLSAHLPACCAKLAQQYLQFNGSFFLAAGYSLYYLLLEPFAGITWAGR